MKSLFQAGRPVLGERLIGREEILEKIIRLLISGQSIVLIAPRRFGKTSIVLEVLNRIKAQGLFTAYIDILNGIHVNVFNLHKNYETTLV